MNLLRDISDHSKYRPAGGDMLKLFQMLITQDVSQEEAINCFSSGAYYRRVKKNLKDNLLDGILLNSFSELTTVQQAHFRIRKRALEVTMLINCEKKRAAIQIAAETLLNAERYGLVDIALQMSRQLEHHYSSVSTHTAKREKYRAKNLYYQKRFLEECQAQSVYDDLAFCVNKKRSTTHLPEAIEALEKVTRENESYRFRLYFYSTKILYAQVLNNQSDIIMTCKAAVEFFNQSKTMLPYTTSWLFSFQKIPVYLAKGQYADASRVIDTALVLPAVGSYNWHLTLLYKVILGFHSDKPEIALKAWKLAKATTYQFKSDLILNRWKIIFSFLALFERMGQLHFSHKFKIYRSLNDTSAPITGKVNLLVSELLHLLLDGKRKVYMNRVEYIETYIQENLKGNARAKYFLRMLRAVELGDYHPVRVQAHAKKHFDLLQKIPGVLNINILDNEPVPYEVLWGMVMDYLKKNKK